MRQAELSTFQQIQANRLLIGEQARVYDLLFREGPLSGKALDEKLQSKSAHKRLSELKLLGVVASNPETRTWDVTGTLPTRQAKTPTERPNNRDLNKAVSELREMWTYAKAAGFRIDTTALGTVGAWLANGAV